MTTMIAPEIVSRMLGELTASTEIRNAAGKVLGYFTPVAEKEQNLYEQAKAYFDAEEVKRRKDSGGPYYSFEQVMAHLQTLERGGCATP